MKSAALCMDELTLQNVVLPLPDGRDTIGGVTELPLLSTHVRAKRRKGDVSPAVILDDGASEAATVKAEDDDDETEEGHGTAATAQKPAELSAAATALGFVERMVREYTLKREIHALISKKREQVRQMQALIATYQEQLVKTITQLEEETHQHTTAAHQIEQEARRRLAEALSTGCERACVETTRAVGLLEVQRHRIVRARTRLRTTVVTTRQEECEWLLKSIIAQHEQECQTLLSATTAKKFLEEGSLQATLAVQITQDDPIFASVETLYESQPLARQLQLQLDSIEMVLSSMKQKCDALEAKHVTPSGPVPLVKRSSFRDRRQDTGFPTTDRKRIVRLCLLEGKRIRCDRNSTDLAARHRAYSSVLRTLDRMLCDVRTRSGRLLHQFVEKLHDDTLTQIQVTSTRRREDDDSLSNQDDDSSFPNDRSESKVVDDALQERFLMARLPSVLQPYCRSNKGECAAPGSVLAEGPAVDTLKLPPPAMITAFAKFLTRVITTEYELLAACPSSVDESSESYPENVDDQSLEDAMDQTVLHDCIHEMVFQRLTTITLASAIDEYNFSRQDDSESGVSRFLFPWHWHDSKALLQGISPAELAFPEDAMASVTSYLEYHAEDVRRNGFLPKTLSLFRAAERETTPKGVVRAAMAGFKMLHREIVSVLSTDSIPSTLPDGSVRRRPQRRGSSFLNADILIPSIVLMMSRLPYADYLDGLWYRALLVEGFRSSALSDGGEEAYYLTCLAAAMEFINTFQPSTTPEIAQDCSICENLRSEITHQGVRIVQVDTVCTTSSTAAASPTPATAHGRPRLARTTQAVGAWSKKEHESIKQLSKWISDQPPTDSSAAMDGERFVAPHELWSHGASTSRSG